METTRANTAVCVLSTLEEELKKLADSSTRDH